MTPKISVIIPVYNVEQYLRECLDSCIHQTLEDIEIVCVDDCSLDNSDKILKDYAAKDNRIKIIKHETNKGPGAARNTGVTFATGEYIWFVDSDDWIAKEACQLLYNTAKKNDIDVLLFQLNTFYNEDRSEERRVGKENIFMWRIHIITICPKTKIFAFAI